jgi:hypothetical protein
LTQSEPRARATGRTEPRRHEAVNVAPPLVGGELSAARPRHSGHLRQNRFFSCALQETHLWRAIRYVERNPIRARLARLAWRYAWSSAAAHVGEVDASGLLNLAAWRTEWKPGRWADALRDADDEGVAQFRTATHVGRPLGDEAFLDRLERELVRPVRASSVGRPRLNRGQEQALEAKIGDGPDGTAVPRCSSPSRYGVSRALRSLQHGSCIRG